MRLISWSFGVLDGYPGYRWLPRHHWLHPLGDRGHLYDRLFGREWRPWHFAGYRGVLELWNWFPFFASFKLYLFIFVLFFLFLFVVSRRGIKPLEHLRTSLMMM